MKKSERIADAENAIQNLFQHYHGMKAAIVGLLDEKPLQQLEHLTANLHSLIQTVEDLEKRFVAGAISVSHSIIDTNSQSADAKDMAKRAVDLCHDIQNKLDNYDSPALVEVAVERIGDLNRQVAELRRELKSLDLLHKKDDEAQQAFNRAIERRVGAVQVTTDNPKPLPETPTNIAVYKLKIPNTADPSANLYWRREESGHLHLCELCSADRAHPCCEALDFPDPGRATKEQPKAYCGLCLQRFYNILCEGK